LRNVPAGRLLLSVDRLPGGSTLVRLRDAEGRRLVESQLNLSTRLAAINRLTGGVAHEIKNPLNSIALRLELLRNRVLPEVPSAKDEIDVIAQEITRLDRVVRTFLDFTRPMELRERPFDLAATAKALVELMRPDLEKDGVRLELSGLDQEAPLLGDEGLIKQAVMNVLSNAQEAMSNGSGGVLSVTLDGNGDEYRLTIGDTGAGIPHELRDRIFQLYYSTKAKGSGIGLAMAFRAVQLHNGAIEVGGEEGRGAALTLRFPAQRSEATA
jgi:signal transduction histidine kinase